MLSMNVLCKPILCENVHIPSMSKVGNIEYLHVLNMPKSTLE